MSAIITDMPLIEPKKEVTIVCEEPDQELLFADWLNALIFEMSTRNMLFSQFEVFIENGRLQASVWGEPINVKHHQPTVEIKGATYTELAGIIGDRPRLFLLPAIHGSMRYPRSLFQTRLYRFHPWNRTTYIHVGVLHCPDTVRPLHIQRLIVLQYLLLFVIDTLTLALSHKERE